MPGYTAKGLDNLLERMLEKIKNIKTQLENRNRTNEEYIKLIKEYKRKIIDYANLVDQMIELIDRIENIEI
jgi:histone deacetylase complex regulatory component SIN3